MLEEDDKCDLILTDLQMPIMDGFEFTTKAHQMYQERQKPVPYTFLCTANYAESLSKQCAEVGLHGRSLIIPARSLKCHEQPFLTTRFLSHLSPTVLTGLLRKPITIDDLKDTLIGTDPNGTDLHEPRSRTA